MPKDREFGEATYLGRIGVNRHSGGITITYADGHTMLVKLEALPSQKWQVAPGKKDWHCGVENADQCQEP